MTYDPASAAERASRLGGRDDVLEPIHPAAVKHLPVFITGPGQTDVPAGQVERVHGRVLAEVEPVQRHNGAENL
jgi:hypothetical protein